MAEIPWLSVDGRIQRLREIGMLKWIFCLKPNPVQWSFAAAVGHRLAGWRATDLKSAAMALLGVPDLTVRDAARLGNLKAVGIRCCSSGQLKVSGYNRPPEWQKPCGSMGSPKATRMNL